MALQPHIKMEIDSEAVSQIETSCLVTNMKLKTTIIILSFTIESSLTWEDSNPVDWHHYLQ